MTHLDMHAFCHGINEGVAIHTLACLFNPLTNGSFCTPLILENCAL